MALRNYAGFRARFEELSLGMKGLGLRLKSSGQGEKGHGKTPN